MLKIGIIGCTGAVGLTFLELLAADAGKYDVYCYASAKSSGTTLQVSGRAFEVREFSVAAVAHCDLVFLCVSGEFAIKHGKELALNSYVVDNSSAFRYMHDVPLLVPPINGSDYNGEKLIANPNCSSAIALMALGPLHRRYGLDTVIVSTYQAASGAGKPAMDELRRNVRTFEDYHPESRSDFFVHDLTFNVVPQVDKFEANGYTKEEMKIVWELRKMLKEPELAVSATAVRVPTLRSHGESISVKFKQPVPDLQQVRSLLQDSFGVEVRDDISQSLYPMPKTSTYKHSVEVGRIRHNLIYGEYGLDMFICGDQLLRGAALNAFEILQMLEKRRVFEKSEVVESAA